MNKRPQEFGKILKDLRFKRRLSLRKICKLANYDPSNWSKIERGKIPPPSNSKILKRWGEILGISRNKDKLQEFVDAAEIAQGNIPEDILSRRDSSECLPVFFRTLRNKKPTKAEVNHLIELIRKS